MLAGIDFGAIATVLEPSAGKGDLAEAIAKRLKWSGRNSYRYREEDDRKGALDCIEIDETLRNTLKGAGFRVVHDDFLTYHTRKHYDLIVMNPPFSDGDRHLLKALELARYGGRVVCVLNAETIRNPYSFERKTLAKKLEELGATVTFHANEFSQAERPTDVEVALISVAIPSSVPDSIILEDLHTAQKAEAAKHGGPTDIVDRDFVQAIVARYRFEIDAGVRLIQEYERIRPHMLESLRGDPQGYCRSPILHLTIEDRKLRGDNTHNDYIRLTRLKYWQALFEAPEFVGQLTNNLQRELSAKVEALADYEFSRVNILSIQRDLSKQTIASIEETIIAEFDRLSRQHHWDKDSANVHYYNGWATNKSWKINEKVIMPGHPWDTIWGKWRFSNCAQELADLEKCLTFLNGGLPPEISIQAALTRAEELQQSSDIAGSFFSMTGYKKGTMHIRFLRKDLLDRLNRFGAQRKQWLPPSYGRRKYADMDPAERAVVDSFEGQASYARVMADPGRYIIETAGMLQLTEDSGAKTTSLHQ
jgi:Domain of unknown function (DUF4942)/Methyltransferase small domain